MNTSELKERTGGDDRELEALLDEHEYARLLKRSLASVRRDRMIGQGCPYVKVGFLVRYRPKDVRAYIEHNLRVTQAPAHLGEEKR